ncbi:MULTISPECIES: DUF1187 family protein [Enterobacterales]|uniref:DUF1187 family protein n=1 Tax=Enterobacterales TaxID=91347 RepID=UPI002ED958B8
MTKFKVTATVIKPGNTPTNWTRFTEKKLTKTECEKMLSVNKEVGVGIEAKVNLENFSCVKAGA